MILYCLQLTLAATNAFRTTPREQQHCWPLESSTSSTSSTGHNLPLKREGVPAGRKPVSSTSAPPAPPGPPPPHTHTHTPVVLLLAAMCAAGPAFWQREVGRPAAGETSGGGGCLQGSASFATAAVGLPPSCHSSVVTTMSVDWHNKWRRQQQVLHL
jgi:hypothetical protein